MESLSGKISAINLLEIVRGYGLEPKGVNGRFKAVCPFHADKDPSMVISTGKGKHKWHCFGCGKHGDAADFVAEYEKVSLLEAFKRLGLTQERLTDGQRKYLNAKKRVLSDFNDHAKNTVDCLNQLMAMWENVAKNKWHIAYHHKGFDHYQMWFYWQEQILLGTQDAKYELVKSIKAMQLVDMAIEAGIL